MASNRALKVADRIKEVIATTLETRVKDPRLGFVTITDVRVTGDLQHASIFYTVFGGDEERAATAAALSSAKGLIRREVGSALGLRITPTIEFFADGLQESASAMNDLMAEVKRSDEELAKLREGAKPVGESDPYKSHDEQSS
jgi:ribosome-binding factor A